MGTQSKKGTEDIIGNFLGMYGDNIKKMEDNVKKQGDKKGGEDRLNNYWEQLSKGTR